MVSTNPGIWIASLLCIGYVSISWKDNPWARIAMETLIGGTIGNSMVDIILKIRGEFEPLLSGELIVLIPIILGALAFFRLSARYGWISRYSTGYLMGVGAGVTAGNAVSVMILKPIAQSILPWAGLSLRETIGQFVVIVTLVTSLAYFVLTRPRTGGLKVVQTLGRYSIFFMIGVCMPHHSNWNLGAMQGMLDLVLHQWLGVPRPM